ncbi:MAG: TolC family protein [Chitinophagaceae bacterium]
MWKYLFSISAATAFSICITGIVQAQQDTLSTVPLRWNLETCLEYAHQNNLQVRNLRLTEKTSEQDLLLSKAAKYPSLSGSASQSIVNSKNADPVVGGFQTQASLSSNFSVSSSVVLFNGGYLNNDIKQKNLSLQIAQLNTDAAINDITLQITQAYLNILLVKENIVYLQDLLETSQAQLKQGKQRFDAGSISRKDYIQFESQSATDKYNLVTAQNSYRQNLLTLKQILQLTSAVDFDVVAPDTLIVKPSLPSLQDAEKVAMATRPEIKSGQLAIDVAEFELKKSKAGRLPTVSLGGSLATGYSDNQDSKYFTQLNNNFYQRAALTVAVPIFSNRVNKTNIERSKIQIEQAKVALLGTKTTLDQAVEQSYIALINAQNQFDAAGVQFKTNEETYNITNEQLKLGAVNMVEVLQQKTLYIQALQAYIQSKYSAIMNQKIFDFYTGVPVTL